MVPVQTSRPQRVPDPGQLTAATISLRPCGDLALIVELGDAGWRRALDARLRQDPLPGTVEHVPAARTVLVRFDSPSAVAAGAKVLRSLELDADSAAVAADQQPVTIGVRYDGPDLADVAGMLGIDTDEVVRRHTGQTWTVEFAGFMPGFGYLTGDVGGLDVARRDTPRTKLPAGSVALAGEFTSVYPRSSPGGWQLIGSTDEVMFDPDRTPPALLVPGARINFEALR